MSDTVIKVENISKEYRLGTISHGTLYRDLQSWSAKLFGKEDPNSQIGLDGHKVKSGTFKALDNVSFDIKQGDVVGIIGRNGAGKSTLLKIISQVTGPNSGVIKIKGRIASLLEVGTGFHPELTGRENVFLNGAILGMSKIEIKHKFDEIVAFSEVEKFIDTPVKRYSSGMYVRLAFAVAAHLEPEILIVDEVLAVGDAQFQKKCLGKMQKVGEEGRTVLFVSHNMNAINQLCKRAVHLANGKVVSQGDVGGVVNQYLQTGFGGSCAIIQTPVDPLKAYQVLEIRVTDAAGSIADRPMKVDEPFCICLKYKLDQALQGGYAVLMIRNRMGEVVLFSDSRDHIDSQQFEEAQNVSIQVKIPAPLLTPGLYRISATLAQHPYGKVAGGQEEVTFEVVDIEGVRQTRAGSIYLPVVWQGERFF